MTHVTGFPNGQILVPEKSQYIFFFFFLCICISFKRNLGGGKAAGIGEKSSS